jgi:hypothetical protein
LRGVTQTLEDCEPFMNAFAERLVDTYGLQHRPVTWLDGKPRAA